MNQFEKYEPVGKIWTSLKNMNQLEKFKLVQKKFEPEVNLNHNTYINVTQMLSTFCTITHQF